MLEIAGVNTVLDGVDRSDVHALGSSLRDAAKQAKLDGKNDKVVALSFLENILTIHLRPDDPAAPYGPMAEFERGRTCIPSDFAGDQNDIIAEFAPLAMHPVLRARLADIAWYNDRKKSKLGKLAVKAYCEIIDQRLNGTLHRSHLDDGRILDLADYAQRMMQIAARLYKRNAYPDYVTNEIDTLNEQAITANEYVAFLKLANIGINYGLMDWQKVVDGTQAITADYNGKDYPMAIQGVWELAAQGYRSLNDTDNQKRAQKEIVLLDLKMRDQVPQASAQAHWVRTAIDKLRQFGGEKDWIADLRRELRDLENASLDDFTGIPYELNLSELASGTIELFEKLTLPDILLQFAVLDQPESKAELEKAADDISGEFVLGSLFSGTHADRDGKIVANTPAKPDDGDEQKDEWYKGEALRHREISRRQADTGKFEPARQNVMSRFPIELRHFAPIVQHSPFVQHGHEHTFALGFARFWQGDFVSAAHLLIPQLENSIRYVLKNSNEDSAKMMSDLTQDDRSLSGLLFVMREQMESIFGVDLIHEVDLLFNFKPGPALRHAAAHGTLTDGACYDVHAIYGCWLIYRMTCLPLLSHWKDLVAPEIEAQSF